jgi:uncharacterized protein (TIGR01777 family)
MKVAVAGSSGLIGTALVQALQKRGDEVQRLPRLGTAPWNFEGADAVVNLAGESIGKQRWTQDFKKEIASSRVLPTRALVDTIAQMQRKPRVLVNASAVGFYGGRGDDVLDESAAMGHDFLATVVEDWEAEARDASIRSVQVRTGVVLAKAGGALEQMLPPFKAFIGGPIGSGRQWFPWIHIEDEVAALLFAVDRDVLEGPVNLASPGIVTMKEFAKALGRALHRPSWAAVPAPALKLLLGEFADVLLAGQRAVPKKLQEAGFKFRFEKLEAALADLFP